MTKHKKLDALITTEGGNHYYAGRSIPGVQFIHPVLKHLITLKEEGKLHEWLAGLPQDNNVGVKIGGGVEISRETVYYFYRYMRFLDQNGYFSGVEKLEMKPNTFKAADVEKFLANTGQIVFEATESCCLNCKYCGFGEFYSDSGTRERRNLDIDAAQKFLDYMVNLFESPLNRRYHKKIALSFYGGEPLENMPFIREVVRLARHKRLTHKEFIFSMTTNGILLDKYMNFLAANDFLVSISLDGDAKHNAYRVFPDGSPSFAVVYNNIKKLAQKHPDYFRRRVNFISVIHNKNSNNDVIDFFEKEFQREPIIIEVNPYGIKPEKMPEFESLFNSKFSDFSMEDVVSDTRDRRRMLKNPYTKSLFSLLNQYSGLVFNRYDNLVNGAPRPWFVCTGTCTPFQKKVFLTARGKIMPCERIAHEFSFGTADQTGVYLDFEEIAGKYNRYYEKLSKKCNACTKSDSCQVCIFTLDISEDTPTCGTFMNDRQYLKDISQQLSMLEDAPQYYSEILKSFQVN